MNDIFLWQATKEQIEKSNLYLFCEYLDEEKFFPLTTDYQKLWKWSIQKPDIFWSAFWDFSNIKGTKGKKIISKNTEFLDCRFFEDSKINFALNLLKKKLMKLQYILEGRMDMKNLLLGKNYIMMFVNYLIFLKKMV